MNVGVAKEIKQDEYRVALTPAGSRELVQGWGYGPSVDGFLAAVRAAANHAGR